jgi:hypothetical protein
MYLDPVGDELTRGENVVQNVLILGEGHTTILVV